jgi:hypothetical protein
MTDHRHRRDCTQPGFTAATNDTSPTGWAVVRCDGCGVVELRRETAPTRAMEGASHPRTHGGPNSSTSRSAATGGA